MRFLFLITLFFLLSGTLEAQKSTEKTLYQKQCVHFCENNIACNHCSKILSCGRGYTANASFGITEKERWFACQKTGSINRIWPDIKKIAPNTTTLIVALGGFASWRTDDGIEWFCENYFPQKEYPNILCISSFAAPKTVSRKLAENIKKTVEEIRKKSGKSPSVILVGKSIGGCKLHHAVAGAKKTKKKSYKKRDKPLKNLPIDLFVGIDVSCSIRRHFDNPKDLLVFPQNVAHIFSFYQNKKLEKQTGHRLVYENQKWNNKNHINVNTENLDSKNQNKNKLLSPLCPTDGHAEIDNCDPLKELIKEIILKQINQK